MFDGDDPLEGYGGELPIPVVDAVPGVALAVREVDETAGSEVGVLFDEIEEEQSGFVVDPPRGFGAEDRNARPDPVLAVDGGDYRPVSPGADLIGEEECARPPVVPDPRVVEHLLELRVRHGVAPFLGTLDDEACDVDGVVGRGHRVMERIGGISRSAERNLNLRTPRPYGRAGCGCLPSTTPIPPPLAAGNDNTKEGCPGQTPLASGRGGRFSPRGLLFRFSGSHPLGRVLPDPRGLLFRFVGWFAISSSSGAWRR